MQSKSLSSTSCCCAAAQATLDVIEEDRVLQLGGVADHAVVADDHPLKHVEVGGKKLTVFVHGPLAPPGATEEKLRVGGPTPSGNRRPPPRRR